MEGALGELIPWKKWSGWTKRTRRIKYGLDCSNNRVGNNFGHDLGHYRGRWDRCKIDS